MMMNECEIYSEKQFGVPIKFIIIKIWSLCVTLQLSKAMMYLLKTFKCCNKHNIYFLECMFCGSLVILSKFDIVNLIPRQICLHCIMLNTKHENKLFLLKIDNEFCPNSLNVLHEFEVII
jgi:hypothetical protein